MKQDSHEEKKLYCFQLNKKPLYKLVSLIQQTLSAVKMTQREQCGLA